MNMNQSTNYFLLLLTNELTPPSIPIIINRNHVKICHCYITNIPKIPKTPLYQYILELTAATLKTGTCSFLCKLLIGLS